MSYKRDVADSPVRECKADGCDRRAWYRVTFSMYNGSMATPGAKVQTWCKRHAVVEADRLNDARRTR